ncbi:hypothetical protein ACJX0J_014194, partial [Zea mays]
DLNLPGRADVRLAGVQGPQRPGAAAHDLVRAAEVQIGAQHGAWRPLRGLPPFRVRRRQPRQRLLQVPRRAPHPGRQAVAATACRGPLPERSGHGFPAAAANDVPLPPPPAAAADGGCQVRPLPHRELRHRNRGRCWHRWRQQPDSAEQLPRRIPRSSEHGQRFGYGAMLRAGMATADSLAGSGSRLKGQLSFSSRQGSLMSQISEMDSEEVGGSSPEAAGGGRGYIPGYPMGSGSGWEDSSALMSDNLSGLKRPRDSSEPGQSRITHQFSLPKTSSEMASIDKFLQFQDAVPCKIRAKRGCATHPRSIAERVRRTKISERIRKLQELVPNMDKQTNTSDMLDLAVDYIKELQKQVK